MTEDNKILSEVLSDLKSIKQTLTDNTTRIIKTEISIETINKGINLIESYKERIIRLEGSQEHLTAILDKTNNTLDKLDQTVDSIKDVITAQRGIQSGVNKTNSNLWEVVKWLGVGSIFPLVKALLDHYNK